MSVILPYPDFETLIATLFDPESARVNHELFVNAEMFATTQQLRKARKLRDNRNKLYGWEPFESVLPHALKQVLDGEDYPSNPPQVVWRKPLVFWGSQSSLYHLEWSADGQTSKTERFALVGETAARLNASSPVIHELNAKTPISFEADGAYEEYISFFCEHVHAEYGGFYCIEFDSDEKRPPGPVLHTTDYAERLRPQGAERETPGVLMAFPITRMTLADTERDVFLASICYGNTVFRGSFDVHENGMIELLEDTRLLSGISQPLDLYWDPKSSKSDDP